MYHQIHALYKIYNNQCDAINFGAFSMNLVKMKFNLRQNQNKLSWMEYYFALWQPPLPPPPQQK
jgi:hypothetical protein